ncbi:response regulator [Leptolyngbya sp. FACHB-36]|nr:response regulator [Leptolyngbya sp. FACHB-36]MBD2020010.1 response regulator [Leptolyngbya sp. FACHB-36]
MSLKKKSILIVDDLADNLFLLKTILEAEGYAVEAASSGRDALARVEEATPDLLLLDVMMPDMTGYEVAHRLRQNSRFASLPIVLITAHDESALDRGEAVGANGFIRKPIDLDELLARVQFFVAGSDAVGLDAARSDAVGFEQTTLSQNR